MSYLVSAKQRTHNECVILRYIRLIKEIKIFLSNEMVKSNKENTTSILSTPRTTAGFRIIESAILISFTIL